MADVPIVGRCGPNPVL